MMLGYAAVLAGICCLISVVITTKEAEEGRKTVKVWAVQSVLYFVFMLLFITGAAA